MGWNTTNAAYERDGICDPFRVVMRSVVVNVSGDGCPCYYQALSGRVPEHIKEVTR